MTRDEGNAIINAALDGQDVSHADMAKALEATENLARSSPVPCQLMLASLSYLANHESGRYREPKRLSGKNLSWAVKNIPQNA